MRLSLCCSILGLFGGYIGALPVVSGRETGLAAVSRKGVESVRGAEASVGVAAVDQIVGMCSVNFRSLRLMFISMLVED